MSESACVCERMSHWRLLSVRELVLCVFVCRMGWIRSGRPVEVRRVERVCVRVWSTELPLPDPLMSRRPHTQSQSKPHYHQPLPKEQPANSVAISRSLSLTHPLSPSLPLWSSLGLRSNTQSVSLASAKMIAAQKFESCTNFAVVLLCVCVCCCDEQVNKPELRKGSRCDKLHDVLQKKRREDCYWPSSPSAVGFSNKLTLSFSYFEFFFLFE